LPRSLVRYYGKKRGDRRTGSRKLGNLGSGCFFGSCFLTGCAALAVILVNFTVPELRVNRDFIEQTCVVVGHHFDIKKHRDGPQYAPRFRVRFQAEGRDVDSEAWYDVTDVHTHDQARSEALLRQFPIGQTCRCWHDPRNPGRVVLSRGYTWFAWLALLFPAPFLALGGAGLFYFVWNWNKSAERRAVEQQRAARHDPFDEAAGVEPKFPYVPGDASLADSRGTTLAFRLPSERAGWQLPALLAGSVVWNGVVAVFVTMAVQGHMAGEPDWLQTFFLAPLVFVGLGLIVMLVRTALIGTGIGPTIAEISEHPLLPGGSYQVFVYQPGRLSVKLLRILLVCEEQATYRQGTNTRTATERVFEREVFRRGEFEIHPERPFEAQLPLEIPSAAMHSFRSDHNQVHWKLVVTGEAVDRKDFDRSFTLHVYPSQLESDAA